jgi:SAM-dependent methyltransferase
MRDASAWAAEVSTKRPWRQAFFDAFVRELLSLSDKGASILEIGSGPGFLAQHLLGALRLKRYTALDFSDAMHALARQRLGPAGGSVEFITRDFLSPAWTSDLPQYTAIVTLQAIHELRHKRKAPILYSQILTRLLSDGIFLVCDHYCGDGGMSDTSLFMSEAEHVEALTRGGFEDVVCIHKEGGMVLYRATPA